MVHFETLFGRRTLRRHRSPRPDMQPILTPHAYGDPLQTITQASSGNFYVHPGQSTVMLPPQHVTAQLANVSSAGSPMTAVGAGANSTEVSVHGKDIRVDIGILGTGWFGRALAKRLTKGGSSVLLGSRNPERFTRSGESFVVPCMVVTLQEVIERSEMLVLALPEAAHEQFALSYGRRLPAGSILVDVSNTDKPGAALRLAELLPHVQVVKALNTVSAYALEGSAQVEAPVCLSGELAPKQRVIEKLFQPLGLAPLDIGRLNSSPTQEALPMQFFGKWKVAVIMTAVIFLFWTGYCVLWYHVLDLPPKYPGDPFGNKPIYKAKQFPLNTMNKILALTGFTIFALTYLPGTIAGLVQLVRGTAKVPFPAVLANWMNVRKQLGLTAMWIITQHMIMSCLLTSKEYYYYPLYMHDVTNKLGPAGERDHTMTVYGEATLMLAVFGYSLFLLVAITSVPSIASAMSWKEWAFVQSKVGHAALAISLMHVVVYASAFNECIFCKDWGTFEYWPDSSAPPSWVSIGIPGLTLVLRAMLHLPGISHRLAKIRSE